MLKSVFPQPALPKTKERPPGGHPLPVVASKPVMPVGAVVRAGRFRSRRGGFAVDICCPFTYAFDSFEGG